MGNLVSRSLDDLDQVAESLLEIGKELKVIAFTGNLGAGKTTLISRIINKLGISDFNGSPTFSLVNEYETPSQETIYHFDFYRINHEDEAQDIGWEEYLNKKDAWVLIEWPQRIENLLPEHFILVNIQVVDSTRIFEWKMF